MTDSTHEHEHEPENPDVKDGQVSDAQGAGPVSDGDAPTGDPDLAQGEQPDPATEPELSEDQKD
jgi:hypothetical protein